MAEKLKLEVAVPERQVLSDSVESVQAPAKDGYIGILPGHAALITELGHGILSFEAGGKQRYMALNGGLMEVLSNSVRVLANSAEWAEEIDSERAEKALQRANALLRNHEIEVDVERAIRAISRAEARLAATRRAQNN